MGMNKRPSCGGGTPRRPANKGEITPSSTYSQRKSTTKKRRYQVLSWAETRAREFEYIRRKNAAGICDNKYCIYTTARMVEAIRQDLDIDGGGADG